MGAALHKDPGPIHLVLVVARGFHVLGQGKAADRGAKLVRFAFAVLKKLSPGSNRSWSDLDYAIVCQLYCSIQPVQRPLFSVLNPCLCCLLV